MVAMIVWSVVACKGNSKAPGDDTSATPVDTDEVRPAERAPTPKEVRVELPSPSQTSDELIPIIFTLPAGWSTTRYDHWFVPSSDPDMVTGTRIVLESACQGSCAPADIAGNIDGVIKGIKAGAAIPNVNTGDPTLDAVRGTFTLLQERDLPSGKLISYRVTYAPAVLASGPYQQSVAVHCFVHRPGDKFYITLAGTSTLDDEARRLPEMIAACESLTIAAPPAAAP
jgi:hypothetical protein